MANDSPPNAPTPNDPNTDRDWFSNTLSAIKGIANFLALAAKEWLPALVDQPIRPPMEYNATFDNEWGRISRLITIVIIISSLLLGGLNLFAGQVDFSGTLKSGFITIIIAFLLALLYRPFAYICGVCTRSPDGHGVSDRPQRTTVISMRQIVFVELYTFVPWLPIFAFIYASVSVTHGEIRDFLLLAPYICVAYIIVNFGKSIRLITNCSWIRIWLSLSVPIALWLFEVVPILVVILYLAYASVSGK